MERIRYALRCAMQRWAKVGARRRWKRRWLPAARFGERAWVEPANPVVADRVDRTEEPVATCAGTTQAAPAAASRAGVQFPNVALLALWARFHGARVEFSGLVRRWAIRSDLDLEGILWGLEQLAMPCCERSGNVDALSRAPLPLLAWTRDARLMLVGRIDSSEPPARGTAGAGAGAGCGGAVLVQFDAGQSPVLMSADSFAGQYAGAWIEPVRGMLTSQHAGAETHGSGGSDSDRAGLPGTRFGPGWFVNALRRHPAEVTQVLVASLFVQVFALATPLVFQAVIDKVLTHQSRTTLVTMLVALAGVAVFETLLSGLRHYLLTHTASRIDVALGAALFRHLMRLPMAYFDARRAGDVIACLRELETARAFFTGQALTAWLDLLFALIFLCVMFACSAMLTSIVIAFLPVFLGASYLISPLLRRQLEDRYVLGADNQSFVAETVGAIETLKGQAVEVDWQRRWETRLVRHALATFEAGQTANWSSQLIGLASRALTTVLLGTGALLVMDGTLTVGGLIAFNMLAGRVNGPIIRLSSLWQEFQQMRVAVKRLGSILNQPAEHAGRGDSTAVLPQGDRLRGQIVFDNVSFRYRAAGPAVLSCVSFSVAPGEIVGIAGSSGAGKTSLIRLVQRLYVPGSGRLTIDGIDLAAVDAAWLRRQLGVVTQEATLMNLSVRDNIALSDPSLSHEAVMQAAALAGADDFIRRLPEGYDTVVGERGNRLSGGQRARIALARALAGNPAILLLDEATASLDQESERAIQANLARICAGRTVLIVAHRLSTLRLADRIVVLEQGCVVEEGCHDVLIARLEGRYRAMFEAATGPLVRRANGRRGAPLAAGG